VAWGRAFGTPDAATPAPRTIPVKVVTD